MIQCEPTILFEVDVLTCQHCGGKRKLLSATTEPGAIRRVLEHLGLSAEGGVRRISCIFRTDRLYASPR